jgi:ribosomal 30S subunit maturation factor RimM
MEIQDLVSVGRLGTVIDREDFVSFRKNDHFQPAFFHENADVFLIFDKSIVFYVTIDRIREEGKKTFLHFAEDGVIDAVRNAGTTEVAYPDDIYRKITASDDDAYDPVDMKAIFEDRVLGTIEDYLENPGQRVLVIISDNGKEILVPDVDAFIERIDLEKRIIYFKDIQGLIDL